MTVFAATTWPRKMSQPTSTSAGTRRIVAAKIAALSAVDIGIPKETTKPTMTETNCTTSLEMYSGVNVCMEALWQR